MNRSELRDALKARTAALYVAFHNGELCQLVPLNLIGRIVDELGTPAADALIAAVDLFLDNRMSKSREVEDDLIELADAVCDAKAQS